MCVAYIIYGPVFHPWFHHFDEDYQKNRIGIVNLVNQLRSETNCDMTRNSHKRDSQKDVSLGSMHALYFVSFQLPLH